MYPTPHPMKAVTADATQEGHVTNRQHRVAGGRAGFAAACYIKNAVEPRILSYLS